MSVFRFFILLFSFLSFGLQAQQESFQALYPFFGTVINPGKSGQDGLELGAMVRRKPIFKNFGGQVNQQFLSLDMPIKEQELGMGMGIYISNLNQSFGYINGGISSNFSMGMSFSKTFPLGKGMDISGGINYSINQFPFLSSNGKAAIRSSIGLGLDFNWENFELEWSSPTNLLSNSINANFSSISYLRANYEFPKNEFGQLKMGLARVNKYGLGGKFDLLLDYSLLNEWSFGLYYLGSGGDIFKNSFYSVLKYELGKKIVLGYGFDWGSMSGKGFSPGQNSGSGAPSGFHQLFIQVRP